MNLSIDNIKRYLRSKVLTAYERKKDVEKTKQDYIKSLGVPSEWLDDALEPEVIRKDSLFNAGMDIHLSDIHAIRPNARFVMFDACYNGSFHLDDCIANAYIFGDGNTVVTQGNTVNTIQDSNGRMNIWDYWLAGYASGNGVVMSIFWKRILSEIRLIILQIR